MKKFSLKKTVTSDDPNRVCEFLAFHTGLSKARVKDAMNKGAVWLKKRGRRRNRIRRATALISAGDVLECYYDETILSLKPCQSECLGDREHYSVWNKSAGLMTQGTMYGDHCSLLRQAQRFFNPAREVFPVHRLDREASGLVLVAHTKDAAAKFSAMLQKNQITRTYRIEVLGNLFSEHSSGVIELPLDGKPALTEFKPDRYNPDQNTSTADVTIRTGRLHQIRRHFEMIGFPVMGDPGYGKGNKNRDGMKLMAVSLRFYCPFKLRETAFHIPYRFTKKIS